MKWWVLLGVAVVAVGSFALVVADTAPIQWSTCGGCGFPVVERSRRPCPNCGSTERLIRRSVHERLGAADRAS